MAAEALQVLSTGFLVSRKVPQAREEAGPYLPSLILRATPPCAGVEPQQKLGLLSGPALGTGSLQKTAPGWADHFSE